MSNKQSNTARTAEKSDLIYYLTKRNKILQFIVRYSIFQNGKSVETNIKGWRTALAHARKYTQNLFTEVKKVEILNLWTGEIIDLAEAERRAAAYARRPKGAVISATT